MNSLRKLLVILALASSAMLMETATQSCSANAQSGCSESCKQAFGACYKSTANRAACEAQLQRCLQGCISQRR